VWVEGGGLNFVDNRDLERIERLYLGSLHATIWSVHPFAVNHVTIPISVKNKVIRAVDNSRWQVEWNLTEVKKNLASLFQDVEATAIRRLEL